MMKKFSIKSLTDKDIELFIGHFLRFGVVVASIVAVIGGALYLYNYGMEIVPNYRVFKGEPESYTTFSGIWQGVMFGNPTEIIQLGVVCLIATPVLRIVLSLFSFTIERDKLYVCITLIVLSVILFSMFSGSKL